MMKMINESSSYKNNPSVCEYGAYLVDEGTCEACQNGQFAHFNATGTDECKK